MKHLQAKKLPEENYKIDNENVTIFRTNNDVNGNHRYLIHFLDFADSMEEAKQKIKQIGGREYRGRDCGGCFVFSSYNVENDLKTLLGQ